MAKLKMPPIKDPTKENWERAIKDGPPPKTLPKPQPELTEDDIMNMPPPEELMGDDARGHMQRPYTTQAQVPSLNGLILKELYTMKQRCQSNSVAYWYVNDMIQVRRDQNDEMRNTNLLENTKELIALRASLNQLRLAIDSEVINKRVEELDADLDRG